MVAGLGQLETGEHLRMQDFASGGKHEARAQTQRTDLRRGRVFSSPGRRGEHPTGPRFPEPGPPEALLTLTSLSTDQRREPRRPQAQDTVRVEDDRREDDRTRPRSGAIVGLAQRRVTKSVSVGSYEERRGAERRAGT